MLINKHNSGTGRPKKAEPIKILLNPTNIQQLQALCRPFWTSVCVQSFPKLSVTEASSHKSHVLSKICSKCPLRCWRQTCICRAKLSITRTHSSLGNSLVLAVIAAFNSPIVW